jgi:hypothetical protein
LIVWDARIAEWVADRLGYETGFGACQALGVVRNGDLRGAVVYHDWQPQHETIALSAFAVDRKWLDRRTIKAVFDYPFSFCQMVWVQTDLDNPARAIFLKLGSDEIVVPRLFGRDRNGVILTLTDDQWRKTKYARMEHDGQATASRTA